MRHTRAEVAHSRVCAKRLYEYVEGGHVSRKCCYVKLNQCKHEEFGVCRRQVNHLHSKHANRADETAA